MTVAIGTEIYAVDTDRVISRGVTMTETEHDQALDSSVRLIIDDEEGKRRAREATASLSLTDFQRQNLEAILDSDGPLEDWRVGEAYGEAYLTEHKRCFFPWPDKWDERKSGSSLPGADLVGLQDTDDEDLPVRFAFGEVKTSHEEDCPPGTMYGRTGLKRQMEDLRNSNSIRNDLFRYLMMRAQNSEWKAQWESATKRYLVDRNDVAIVGVLIRDVPPDKRDLEARSTGLSNGHPAKMHIELLAIYLPSESIAGLAAFYITTNGGR